MIWMLVDCYRRRRRVLLVFCHLLSPCRRRLGLLSSPSRSRPATSATSTFGGVLRRGPSLDQLRYLADQTPTLTNHLNLAQRLIEVGQPRRGRAASGGRAQDRAGPRHGPLRPGLLLPGARPTGRGRAGAGKAAAPRQPLGQLRRLAAADRNAGQDSATAPGRCRAAARWRAWRRRCKTAVSWRTICSNRARRSRPGCSWSSRCATTTSPPATFAVADGRWAAEARRLLKETESAG